MQPDGVGIPENELIHIHAIDGRWPPNALLLSVHEDDHELHASASLRCFLRRGEFALTLWHHTLDSEISPNAKGQTRGTAARLARIVCTDWLCLVSRFRGLGDVLGSCFGISVLLVFFTP